MSSRPVALVQLPSAITQIFVEVCGYDPSLVEAGLVEAVRQVAV
jgi:hypothetical protein